MDPANSVYIQQVLSRTADLGKLYLVNSADDITASGTIDDYILRNYSTMATQGRENLPLAVLPSLSVSNNLDSAFAYSTTFGAEAFSNFYGDATGIHEVGDFLKGGIKVKPGDNNVQIFSKNIGQNTSVDYATVRTPQIFSPASGNGFNQGGNQIQGYAFAVSPAAFVSYSLDYAANVTQQLFSDSSPPAASLSQIVVTLLTADGSQPLPSASDLIKTQVFYVDIPAGITTTADGAFEWHVRFQPASPQVQQPISFSYSAQDTLTGQTITGGPFTLNNFQPIPVNNPISGNPYRSQTEVLGTSDEPLGTWDSLNPPLQPGSYSLRLTVNRTENGTPLAFTHVVENIFVFGPNTSYPYVGIQLAGIPVALGNLIQNPVSAGNGSQVVFQGFDDAGPGIDHYEVALADTGFSDIPVLLTYTTSELDSDNVAAFINQKVLPFAVRPYQMLGNHFTNNGNGTSINRKHPACPS